MLDTFSKSIIYKSLGQPYQQTLFVELLKFSPGQPDNNPRGGSAQPRSSSPGPSADVRGQYVAPPPTHAPVVIPPPISASALNTAAQNVPPPPWSRWGAVATPSQPPSVSRRPELSSVPLPTQPQETRKRKHLEDSSSRDELLPPVSSLAEPSSKRRNVLPPVHHQPTLPSIQSHSSRAPVPTPQTQSLSPSLARLMSPVDQSPRSKYSHPSSVVGSSRNGHDNHHGSPLMRPGGVDILNSPPMRSLQRDGPRPIRDNVDTVLPVASSSTRNGYTSPIIEREIRGGVDMTRHKSHGSPILDRNGHDKAHMSRNGYINPPPSLATGIDAPPIRKLMLSPGKP